MSTRKECGSTKVRWVKLIRVGKNGTVARGREGTHIHPPSSSHSRFSFCVILWYESNLCLICIVSSFLRGWKRRFAIQRDIKNLDMASGLRLVYIIDTEAEKRHIFYEFRHGLILHIPQARSHHHREENGRWAQVRVLAANAHFVMWDAAPCGKTSILGHYLSSSCRTKTGISGIFSFGFAPSLCGQGLTVARPLQVG